MATTAGDPVEAAKALRRLLDAIEAAELTASTATRYRLEGAVIALEALATGQVPPPEAFSDAPPSRS